MDLTAPSLLDAAMGKFSDAYHDEDMNGFSVGMTYLEMAIGLISRFETLTNSRLSMSYGELFKKLGVSGESSHHDTCCYWRRVFIRRRVARPIARRDQPSQTKEMAVTP